MMINLTFIEGNTTRRYSDIVVETSTRALLTFETVR